MNATLEHSQNLLIDKNTELEFKFFSDKTNPLNLANYMKFLDYMLILSEHYDVKK